MGLPSKLEDKHNITTFCGKQCADKAMETWDNSFFVEQCSNRIAMRTRWKDKKTKSLANCQRASGLSKDKSWSFAGRACHSWHVISSAAKSAVQLRARASSGDKQVSGD